MPPIDERVARLVKISCSVEEYNQLTSGKFNPWNASDRYWQCIPNYLVSRCPFCGLEYYAQYDAYSIAFTPFYSELGRRIAAGNHFEHETQHCEHYLACDPFNYLHDFEEVKEKGWAFESRTPGIQPHLFADDLESFAVIHALPICRVENEQFVPRFTKFLVIYFASSPETVFQRWRNRESAFASGDPDYYNVLLSRTPDTDLIPWVERGKLKWLDINQSDLPLTGYPASEFPYANLIVKST
jgi:hypothetical protein